MQISNESLPFKENPVMCGIGYIMLAWPSIFDGAKLKAMAYAMSFHGSDDKGISVTPHIGLSHRRLNIHDQDPAGHYSMTSVYAWRLQL